MSALSPTTSPCSPQPPAAGRPSADARSASATPLRGTRRPGALVFQLSPLLLYLYPAVAALLVRSQVPQVAGRYSQALAVFNVCNVLLCALVVWACWRGSFRGQAAGYGLIILLSFLIPGNNELRQLPLIVLVLPLIRLLASVNLVALAFRQAATAGSRPPRLTLMLGTGFATLTVVDFFLLAWLAVFPRPDADTPSSSFRENYDLTAITPNDLLLIGDSFVWGSGVRKEDAFGFQLQARYAQEGSPTKVYSLGKPGGDFPEYLDALALVPAEIKAQRVVLAFYMNDMPLKKTRWPGQWDRTQYAPFNNLGLGCPSLRLLSDTTGKLLYPDVETYHQYLIDSYDPNDPTFPARWEMLEGYVDRFRDRARERSLGKPLFVILPLVVDYNAYPLTAAHGHLVALAERSGYETLDLLPHFRAVLGDGRAYRVAPNDNHFDARGHELVARVLKERLAQR
jgi:hypothetical protein